MLLGKLGINESALIAVAYTDLMESAAAQQALAAPEPQEGPRLNRWGFSRRGVPL